jgi:hypothetical protein
VIDTGKHSADLVTTHVDLDQYANDPAMALRSRSYSELIMRVLEGSV